MDESMLLNGVLRSVLGGRRRRSTRALRYLTRPMGGLGASLLSNPTVLLTAAGVAWGIFETMQQGQSAPAGGSAPGSSAGLNESLPPLPNAASTGVASDQAMQIVRLAISAANADGSVSDEEKTAILEQARLAGVERVVEQELLQPRRLADVVAGVTDSAHKATLYVLAFGILRGDEQPSGAERIYLAKLAHLLGLDPAAVQQLEQKAGAQIDAEAVVAG